MSENIDFAERKWRYDILNRGIFSILRSIFKNFDNANRIKANEFKQLEKKSEFGEQNESIRLSRYFWCFVTVKEKRVNMSITTIWSKWKDSPFLRTLVMCKLFSSAVGLSERSSWVSNSNAQPFYIILFFGLSLVQSPDSILGVQEQAQATKSIFAIAHAS